MNAEPVPGAQLARQLESPVEQARLDALSRLDVIPNLPVLRAVRLRALADESPQVRSIAGELLLRTAGRVAGEELGRFLLTDGGSAQLVALLFKGAPPVRAQVARCLALNLSPHVPPLIARAMRKETEPFVQSCLLQSLAATGGSAAVPALVPFLEAPDVRVRLSAIESLEVCPHPELVGRLLPLLEDAEPRIRIAAALAIEGQDRQEIKRTVEAALGSTDPRQVRMGVHALRFFDPGKALPRLVPFLDHPDDRVRQAVQSVLSAHARQGHAESARALARVPAGGTDETPLTASMEFAALDRAIPSLEERLVSTIPGDRIEAIMDAVREGRKSLVGLLESRLNAELDTGVQATLITAIGHLGEPGVARIQAIVRFMKSPDHRVRANVVEALGRLLSPADLANLKPLLDDPAPRVRANAAVALHAVQPGEALRTLGGMIDSGDIGHTRTAIWALATLASPEAVGLLGRTASEADPEVRRRAVTALESLAPVLPEARTVLAEIDGAAPATGAPPPAPAPAGAVALADLQTRGTRDGLFFELRHESAGVRIAAARKIAATGDPALIPELAGQLKDPDPGVRRSAREAMRELLTAVTNRDLSVDFGVVKFIARDIDEGGDTAHAALDDILDSSIRTGMDPLATMLVGQLAKETDPRLRARMATLVAILGREDVHGAALEELAADPDSRVRANALEGLALMSDGVALRRGAIRALEDPDPRVRAAALMAAEALDRKALLQHLDILLSSRTESDRAAGIQALRSLTLPERFELLAATWLKEPSPNLSGLLAELLALEIASGRVEEGMRLMEGLPPGERRSLLESHLGRIRGRPEPGPDEDSSGGALAGIEEIVKAQREGRLGPDLIRQLLASEPDPAAVGLLLRAADAAALPDLGTLVMTCLDATDRRTRLAVAEALAGFAGFDRSESLRQLLLDEDPEVSQRAADALGQVGLDQARPGLLAMLASGQPWAMRRGFELLEARGRTEGLALLIEAIERSPVPALMDQASRLLLAWGDDRTLQDLVRIYHQAEPRRRPLLGQLGRCLANQIGRPASSFDVAPKSVGVRRVAPTEPVPLGLSRSIRVVLDSLRFETDAAGLLERIRNDPARLRMVGGGIGLLLVLFLLSMGGGDGPAPDGGGGGNRPTPPRTGPGDGLAFTAPARRPDLASFSGGAPVALAAWEPKLEDVEENLRLAFASRGIRSKSLIHIMALDRFQIDYRRVIARARSAAREGRYQDGLLALEQAMAGLGEDHLAGRLAVAKAMIAIAREAERWDLVDSYRQVLIQLREALLLTIVEAARQGDLPEDEIKAVLDRIEKVKTKRARTAEAADWLSGRETGSGEVEEAPSIMDSNWEEEFQGP